MEKTENITVSRAAYDTVHEAKDGAKSVAATCAGNSASGAPRSASSFGHSGLLDMVQMYTNLVLSKVDGGYWVSLKSKEAGTQGVPKSQAQ
ncbi:hypothetical protein LZ009_17520 [Ramlibacter sp. XY19]|uniref:hypothetical protein n=1 Tax=Ramlibacter paludis TaxID=2908000 RepID=UPI0023DC8EEC|nr:hypothetical protein [Ramlibacter paludis]MCG2594580.1 hypothetical protein [Ramlibacter paludis]